MLALMILYLNLHVFVLPKPTGQLSFLPLRIQFLPLPILLLSYNLQYCTPAL